MQTSAAGVAALELEEGVVLKAYRCPAGHWTIGAGLTAASGVVKPKAGMTITRIEATDLLQKALRQNYEPAVAKAMPGARSHEFDAGGSFHFNTGAIARATWVQRWRAKEPGQTIRAGLAAWNKGGGKVLPGLVNRRAREADMLLLGVYPAAVAAKPKLASGTPPYADWALPLTSAEKARVGPALASLGYKHGAMLDAVLREAVVAFQRDHDLTADGIIGRATLSTLQRMLDARGKAKVAAPVAIVAAPVAGTDIADQIAGLPWAGSAIGVACAAYGIYLAFTHRDAVAAAIHRPLPRLAAFLRSF